MTLKILNKRSLDVTNGVSDAPLPTDIEYGEIAVNYADADPALFIRDSNDVVRRLSIDGTPNKKYSVANDDAGLVGGDATTAINAALITNGDISAAGDLGVSDQCEITDSGNPDANVNVTVGTYWWDGTVWFLSGGVTQIVAGNNVTIDPADGTGVVTVNSIGGGVTSIIAGAGIAVDQATGDVTITNTGGGGGSTTPVPQKVAYLKDEKPDGTSGGASVVGWQDRTLNTKEDANNLVVLGNNKEFTLSAGEYQIEWSAPGYQVASHQTKLTNVTDGTTQEMGSSEYSSTASAVTSSSFGSAHIKITSDTTYKIEHYCLIATAPDGLGVVSNAGESEVYTQVTITDLAIVGGTGTDAWGSVNATGALEQGYNATTSLLGTGQYYVAFNTQMPSPTYAVNATASYLPNSVLCTCQVNSKTVNGFSVIINNANTGSSQNNNFNFTVNATNAQLPDTFTIEQFNDLVARVTALENA